MNENGKISGKGQATTSSGTIFSGFWLDGIEHGLCKWLVISLKTHSHKISIVVKKVPGSLTRVYECRDGKTYGRVTEYIE